MKEYNIYFCDIKEKKWNKKYSYNKKKSTIKCIQIQTNTKYAKILNCTLILIFLEKV